MNDAAHMSHAELVKRAVRWLRTTRRMKVVAAEPCAGRVGENPDAIGWDGAGRSVLVEVKVSVADFRRDRDKPCRRNGTAGMGGERWYLTPPDLLNPCQLSDGWGLLELRNDRVCRVVPAVERTDAGIAECERPLIVAMVRAALLGYSRGVECAPLPAGVVLARDGAA